MSRADVGQQLARLYTDHMTVWRYQAGAFDPDGAMLSQLEPAPTLEDIPCRISYDLDDSPLPRNDQNPVSQRLTLFCCPDIPLQNGDYVTVRRGDSEVYSGRIGQPRRYSGSLQTPLLREDG